MVVVIEQTMIQYIAQLARLKLSESEAKEYGKSLNKIVAYIDTLSELDTAGVEPTSHPLPMLNVFREDQKHELMSRDDVFKNAPESEDGYFRVPRILNN